MRLKNNRGLFITGTDTGVGKTYVTRQILSQLKAQSISCVAMKPIAAGAVNTPLGLRNDDALLLQQESSVCVDYELINPYCFEPALAPHLAAQQHGITIESSIILDAFLQLSEIAEVVLVEGIGGWLVPLNPNSDDITNVAALAECLQLPVLLVVALKMGCLNQALLSNHSIYNSRCDYRGWIANSVLPDFNAVPQHLQTLQHLMSVPQLAFLRWKLARDEGANSDLCAIDLGDLID